MKGGARNLSARSGGEGEEKSILFQCKEVELSALIVTSYPQETATYCFNNRVEVCFSHLRYQRSLHAIIEYTLLTISLQVALKLKKQQQQEQL